MTFFDAIFGGGGDQRIHPGLLTGHDDLPGRIEIRRLDAKFLAKRINFGAIFANDGGHATHGFLTGQLHQPPAFRDDLQSGSKIKYSGGSQRRDLHRDSGQGANFTSGNCPGFFERGDNRQTMDK